MATVNKAAAEKVIKQTGVMESRNSSDTIRLWENYRDQATLWRAISLLQIPATALALIFALIMWANRTTVLNVPRSPLPGMYSVKEIPDTEFIDVATDFLNLIASYQHNVARRQFQKASEMIQEPLLTRFRKEIAEDELRTIESTNRTQAFFVDPETISVKREEALRQITVEMTGDRLKIVAGSELPLVKTRFSVTLTTTPRNKLNPFGIVVVGYSFEDVKR